MSKTWAPWWGAFGWTLAACVEPVAFEDACGDGVQSVDEVCDDGVNDGAYGGCLPTCRALAPRCGDGTLDASEACDDGLNDGTYGSCASDCSAFAGRCGDAEVTGPEACDDGVNEGGYGGCQPGCLARGPRCGDGVVNGPEACDDGVNDGLCGSCTVGCEDEVRVDALVGLTVLAVPSQWGAPADVRPDVYVVLRDASGELLWRMPLAPEYAEQIKSPIADLANLGGPGGGGSITAALFLKEFVGKESPNATWAHLDIAGPVWNDKRGGATGYGVRTLVGLVERMSSS